MIDIPEKFEFEITTTTQTMVYVAGAVIIAGFLIAGFSAWIRTKF